MSRGYSKIRQLGHRRRTEYKEPTNATRKTNEEKDIQSWKEVKLLSRGAVKLLLAPSPFQVGP